MDQANCIGNEEPFDLYEKGGAYAQEADDLCIGCPVIKECFLAGQRNQWGQWGGVYWAGNGQPDLKANEHKSQEYLDKVEELTK